jgi:queuosine precursor transporter
VVGSNAHHGEVELNGRGFRFLDLITASFVAVLLISNIASTKIVELGPFTFDGGTVLFPLAYIFGDILTEVYGFARARRVIWTGFLWIAIAAGVFALIDALPAAPEYELAESFSAILGQTPRIVLGSLLAFVAGAFVNSVVLARLKVRTGGRFLWLRAMASTVIGQGIDTAVFLMVAFGGVLSAATLREVFVSNYVFKVGVEVVLMPVTYVVVILLKRAEGIDAFDRRIDFNPFRWRIERAGVDA